MSRWPMSREARAVVLCAWLLGGVTPGCTTPVALGFDGGGALDARTDAGSTGADAAADGGDPVDGGLALADVGPPTIGCASGVEDQVYLPGSMVGCDGAEPQCTAASLCGAGWHLCTYSEFAARGGATMATTVNDYWIASCLRDGPGCALEVAPTDTICTSCSGRMAGTQVVAHICPGGGTRSSPCPSGVTASVGPLRLLNETLCVYGSPTPTDILFGAACCR